MKLTCCCGASIEVEEIDPCLPRVEFDRRLLSRRNNLECFNARHQDCIDKWRENIDSIMAQPVIQQVFPGDLHRIAVPMYTVHCDSAGREIFRRCTTCGGIINPTHYHKGMTLCGCEKPDPYARFRDAIREGKRVFRQNLSGVMELYIDAHDMRLIGYAFEDKPDVYFIEGVDIPTQPTQEWLDKYGVELTGECREPLIKDLWAPTWFHNSIQHGTVFGDKYDPFTGRRWIVKRKQPESIIKRILDVRTNLDERNITPGYAILGQKEFNALNEECRVLDHRHYTAKGSDGFMIDGLRIVLDPVYESRIDVAPLHPRIK